MIPEKFPSIQIINFLYILQVGYSGYSNEKCALRLMFLNEGASFLFWLFRQFPIIIICLFFLVFKIIFFVSLSALSLMTHDS
jgi:hypothetical protein